VVAAFSLHHHQYASAFAAFFSAANATAPTAANPKLLAAFEAQVTAGGNSTLTALAQLEELAAATWFWILGQFQNQAGAKTFATILVAEGQHAIALGVLAGGKPGASVPTFQDDSKKITPTDYPVPAASGASGTNS